MSRMLRYPPPSRIENGGVAVFADSHLGQVDGDADDFLEALSGLTDRGIRTVVLLGDILQYFIGDRKFASPLVKKVVAGWESLSREGMSFRYVEGNRDFFLANSLFSKAFTRCAATDGIEIGGRRFGFVHGDRINTHDVPYRMWLLVSKNPVSRAVLRVTPGPLARKIVARAEARLYRTNFKHKRHLPEAALLAEGRRAREAGYDELLIGHFHREVLLQSETGVARILPAWLQERRHLEIGFDGTPVLVEEPTAFKVRKPQGK